MPGCITGIRSCTSATSEFGFVVSIVHVSIALYDDPLSPRQRRTLLHKLASRKTQEEMFRRWGLLPKSNKR